MLLYICIFLLTFVHSNTTIAPTNPLVEQKDACEAIGPDLNRCEQEEKCTFYDISIREVFTLRSPVEVYTPSGWATGEVTAVHQAVGQDELTIEYPCQDGTDEVCTVTDDRYSMRFRQSPHTEISGIRVSYPASKQREKLDRLDSDAGVVPSTVYTRISEIADDGWNDIWIYAAYGEIVGLQGPDLIISKHQDCLFDPIYIPDLAEQIRIDHNQVPEAVFCTQIMNEFDCDAQTNCVWEETVCLANHWTNDLLTCHQFKNQTACDEHMEPNCKWLAPNDMSQYDAVDTYCICCSAPQLNLIILFSLLFIIFIC